MVIALALIMIGGTVVRRMRRRTGQLPTLRTIKAYEFVPRAVGHAIESSQPLHLAFGGSGIGGQSTVTSLASAEFFYQIAQQAVISDSLPIITMSDPSALPLAQDTLRRALKSRGLVRNFNYTAARWYPSGSRSLTYGAALSTLIATEGVSTSFLAGSFGAELALIQGAHLRHMRRTVAVSDQLEGQAVAYAFSNEILIGEEMFAAGAYLGGDTGHMAQIITLDSLRYVLVAALIVLLVVKLTTGGN